MEHIPVLLNDTLKGLDIKENGVYLDLTLGRAGHAKEILKRLTNGKLVGVDQDIEAIKKSEITLKEISDNFILVNDNFVNIPSILESLRIKEVDGVLMDLGVSSPQFDEGDRGFSYREDAPLDMRMDQIHNSLTAKEVVNTYTFEQLCRVLRDYGDEKYAASIADNIIKSRKIKPIETTFELVDIIKKSKPQKELKKVGHPAKQTFQALRIEVNDELNVLAKTIEEVLPLLKRGEGRLAIITFHSGEDRIVKNIFKKYTVVEGDRINLPSTPKEVEYELVNRKPIIASEEELKINPRSASAKLRIIKRK